MSLIYLDKVNEIINEFLAPFDCTAEPGTDFEYIYAKSEIHYAFVVSVEQTDLFMADINRRYPTLRIDPFLMSLMHELGHHMTGDELSDEEEQYSMYMKNEVIPLRTDPAEKFNLYASLPDEYEATRWAAEYAIENKEEIATFWNKLRPVLMEFYRINGIER